MGISPYFVPDWTAETVPMKMIPALSTVRRNSSGATGWRVGVCGILGAANFNSFGTHLSLSPEVGNDSAGAVTSMYDASPIVAISFVQAKSRAIRPFNIRDAV